MAVGLRHLGIAVTTTPEAGLLGADDVEQVAYGLRQGRVIFTQDEDFLVLASQGVNHAGVAFCQQQSRSLGQIISGLELIWEVYEPDEMRNRVEYI